VVRYILQAGVAVVQNTDRIVEAGGGLTYRTGGIHIGLGYVSQGAVGTNVEQRDTGSLGKGVKGTDLVSNKVP